MTDTLHCIFCKIAKGQISCAKVFENDHFLAFLDISPANKGHTLVVPKEHCETIVDISKETLIEMADIVQGIAKKITEGLKCDGINIIQNNKRAAGQLVPHFHIHIIPRFKDDGQDITWKPGKYQEGEMENTLRLIKMK